MTTDQAARSLAIYTSIIVMVSCTQCVRPETGTVVPAPTSEPTSPPTATVTATAADPPVVVTDCEWLPSRASRSVLRPRIVGGLPVPVGRYPAIGALETKRGFQYCAATVIAPRWALTAAHCQVEPGDRLHLGVVDLGLPGVRLEVAQVRNHPLWHGTPTGNDVAVLELDEATTVEPVELATYAPESGPAMAVGWGATCEECDTSRQLLDVQVPIVSRLACTIAYPGSITDTMLCAGTAGLDSCQGDSGGPLFVDGNVQLGIVSWGEGCARPGAPGVYTSVPSVVGWIRSCTQ